MNFEVVEDLRENWRAKLYVADRLKVIVNLTDVIDDSFGVIFRIDARDTEFSQHETMLAANQQNTYAQVQTVFSDPKALQYHCDYIMASYPERMRGCNCTLTQNDSVAVNTSCTHVIARYQSDTDNTIQQIALFIHHLAMTEQSQNHLSVVIKVSAVVDVTTTNYGDEAIQKRQPGNSGYSSVTTDASSPRSVPAGGSPATTSSSSSSSTTGSGSSSSTTAGSGSGSTATTTGSSSSTTGGPGSGSTATTTAQSTNQGSSGAAWWNNSSILQLAILALLFMLR